jgi:membrane protease YdiL (CAAX protease family)
MLNRHHYLPYFVLSLLIWTTWSVVMLYNPEISTTHSYPRAVARVSALLIPSLVFLWFNPVFRKEHKIGRAMFVGAVLSIGLYVFHILADAFPDDAAIPTAGAIWLNWIIGSPLAEELLFRGIILREELKRRPAWVAIPISSVCFALFHLPSWITVQQQPLFELLTNSFIIFIYGIVFGIIYWLFRSIWATFLPHAANNLIAQLLNPL